MNGYPFTFRGGQEESSYNGKPLIRKFYLFAASQEIKKKTIDCLVGEDILFAALKTGVIQANISVADSYISLVPVVKLFGSIAGFGSQKKYFTQYVDLSNKCSVVGVKPIPVPIGTSGTGRKLFFDGVGALLRAVEVKELIGVSSPAMGYFSHQTKFTTPELREMFSIEKLDVQTGCKVKVRKLLI